MGECCPGILESAHWLYDLGLVALYRLFESSESSASLLTKIAEEESRECGYN
jgi:hypothetical protein